MHLLTAATNQVEFLWLAVFVWPEAITWYNDLHFALCKRQAEDALLHLQNMLRFTKYQMSAS